MQDDKKRVKTVKKIYPQIYSYILPDVSDHEGWQKVGYTERKDVDERIREQTQTAAIKLNYKKLWSASSFFSFTQKFFTDKDLHKFYVKNGIEQSAKQDDGGFGEEWFYFDGTPEVSKKLFDNYTSSDYKSFTSGRKEYTLRDEQEDAISKTLSYAANHQTTDFYNPNPKAKYLWNAKPRFGKTLTSYDFAKRFDAKNVLIVTNRPAIANSWFDDYEKFIDGYYFISTTESLKERKTLTREEFIGRSDRKSDDRQITFLSLQDLKGGKIFGGSYDKLSWVAELDWDLLIVDEAHEGVDTERTDKAFDKIKRRFTLHLSGTPFKAIADGYFNDNQIFNWTYIDEQKAKQAELAAGNDSGDHTNLPDMRLFTYKMSDMISGCLDGGMELDDENVDFAFDLNEMFATNEAGRFLHEQDIITFLDQLTTNEKYPFSTEELRNELKHTFWLVGNRVASAKAMERLLRQHPVFGQYKIILAAGDGKPNADDDTSEEEMQNIKANEKAYDRVKKAIRENDKTITLSVGQLTTGVTIEEWSAVLMLSDIKSESLYMQAIFRSQNPYKFIGEDGETYRKRSAYVFDFSPNRVLRVYDKFANSLLAPAATGKITEKERQENVAELLNYFPVLAEDKNGEMIELDAEQVLTFPKAIIAKEVVKRGFVTNLLFVNINNVFNIPTEVIDSLNKAQSTNDMGKKMSQVEDVNHDPERKTKKEHRISVNKDRILNNKIYGNKMQEIVAEVVATVEPEKVAETIIKKYTEQVSEPLAAYKEIYSPSKTEFEEIEKEHIEKAKEIVEEFISKDINVDKNQTAVAEQLSTLIENDLANDLVVHKEEEVYEKEEESEMDQIRKKLRTFTRAIPSFVMACKDPNTITIDNIEDTVSDEDFKQLFTEKDSEPFTKDDFRKIRGPFTASDGTVFEGFFDKYTFNAAIREFEEKRKEVADYLVPGTKEDIFSYIRPLKTNQIFTPRRIVNKMLDLLEEENPGIYNNPYTTFVDLYVKSGMYLTELAKRLNRGLESQIPDRSERIKHIFEKQLFGFAPTNIIYNISRKYIFGNFDGVNSGNLKQQDLTEPFKKGNTLGMKFDIVIGNPPYQLENDNNNRKTPIYNNFWDSAIEIADSVELITPARFLFDTGQTSSEWNKKMLENEHLKVVLYEPESEKIFSNTDIKGGVAICYYDKLQNFGKIGTFVSYPELNDILLRVRSKMPNFTGIDSIASARGMYRFTQKFFNEYPDAVEILGSGTGNMITSNVFEKLPEIFVKEPIGDNYIKIYGRSGFDREIRYIYKDYVQYNNYTDAFKVMLPKANGSGELGEALSTPFIGEPGVGGTDTFISFGPLNTQKEADALLKYIKTKFARIMLGIKKTTQNNARGVWELVPLQDFSDNSDIDWSKSIPEIDQQLYKKYNLDQPEIDFIEEKVKAME